MLIWSFYDVSICTRGIKDSIPAGILGDIIILSNLSSDFFYNIVSQTLKRNDTASLAIHSIIGIGFYVLKQTQVCTHTTLLLHFHFAPGY